MFQSTSTPAYLCQASADSPQLRVIHQLPGAVQGLLAKSYCACDLSDHVDVCHACVVGLVLSDMLRGLQERQKMGASGGTLCSPAAARR